MPNFFEPNIKKLESKKNIEGLIKALSYQKDVQIRIDAAQALGNIADIRAIDPLLSSLIKEDERVREAACKALRKIGDPAIEYLINCITVFSQRDQCDSLSDDW